MSPQDAVRLYGLKGAKLKRFTQFHSKVSAWIESIGGVRNPDDSLHDFTVATKAGSYHCSPDCHCEGDGYGDLMGRFDSVDLARQFVDCNPYSGKWNHHFFGDWTMETIMPELKHQFRNIVINQESE